MSVPPTSTRPARHFETSAGVAEQGERHRGLARTGLAHEPHELAGADLEGHVVDDVDGAPGQAHAQPVHVDHDVVGRALRRGLAERAHSSPATVGISSRVAVSASRSMPMATRATASVNVLMPIVSRAIRAAGTMTAHGFNTSPMRFSLIMVPQFGAGGGWPKPRNDRPGDDDDRVGHPEAALHHQRADQVGQDLFGHDLAPFHSEQLDGLHEVPFGDVERRRAHYPGDLGGVREPDGQDGQPHRRADDRHQQQRKYQLGEGQDHVDGAHDDRVPTAPEVGGGDAAGAPDRHTERHRRGGHRQEHPTSVEHTGEHVATQLVAAQEGAPRRPGEGGDDAGRGRVGSHERPEHGDGDHEADHRQAEPAPRQRRRPAAGPPPRRGGAGRWAWSRPGSVAVSGATA